MNFYEEIWGFDAAILTFRKTRNELNMLIVITNYLGLAMIDQWIIVFDY